MVLTGGVGAESGSVTNPVDRGSADVPSCSPAGLRGIRPEQQSLRSQQVSLVVNVASECGFTEEHYKDLQQLQRDFGPYHFNVLAFPCNQFGQQEPGSDKEIDSFVRRVYGVSFPLFSKISIVGTGANNVYKYLVEASGKEPDWNFWKYLIDVNGKVVDTWGPKVPVKEIRPKVAEMVRQIILKKKEEL
ncbi:glutathione peroxidase 7 isoform X1 [Pleuronectes platessa]|uniref:glutathione peroxidase 7 isoform X1 n=1 Tax=Pleuronectes platessa TaxID=8262 RepID=UPI00232A23D3|nr:glutathione peroxidase 7 isoform X1 [Pleuronectes platessa]